MASKLEKYAEGVVEKVLEGEMSIEDGIEELNKRLAPFDAVKTQRDKLMAARRALLGVGARLGGNPGTRVTQDEVSQFMDGKEPMTAQEAATAMGHPEPVIRGHFNRGKGEWIIKLDNGKWVKRDPENDEEEDDDE